MKKYIKPTAEVVELSVKESLSALPGNLQVNRTVTRAAALATTAYADVLSLNTDEA